MKLFRGISVLSLVLVTVSACSFLKKGGGDDGGAEGGMAAADEAGAATTPPPAAGAAANEQDIARFPDETKMNDVAATVKRPYNVRDAPPAGAIVAGVNPGQGVTQMASRGNYVLIAFDDAKQGKKLMGWVHKDAFTPQAPDAGIADPKCTAPEVALVSDNTGFCGKPCAQDSECSPDKAGQPQACHGSAAKWDKGKASTDTIKVCTVFHPHDAGAPAKDGGSIMQQRDGGGLTAADAGAGGLPLQTAMIAPPTDGKCPENAHLVKKDKQCHMRCPVNAICKDPAKYCGKCDGVSVCNAERGFCN
jgi:hypothetical protein